MAKLPKGRSELMAFRLQTKSRILSAGTLKDRIAAMRIIREKRLPITRDDLKRVSGQGFVDFVSPGDSIRVMGHLIRLDGYPPAAIGFGILPEDDPAEVLKLSEETARRIIRNLTPETRAY